MGTSGLTYLRRGKKCCTTATADGERSGNRWEKLSEEGRRGITPGARAEILLQVLVEDHDEAAASGDKQWSRYPCVTCGEPYTRTNGCQKQAGIPQEEPKVGAGEEDEEYSHYGGRSGRENTWWTDHIPHSPAPQAEVGVGKVGVKLSLAGRRGGAKVFEDLVFISCYSILIW